MDKDIALRFNLKDALPAIQEDTVVSRSLYKDEKTDITLFGFSAGQELTEHSSPYTAILEVIEGEAEITTGTEKRKAQAGTWILMPPNLPHSLRTITPFTLLLTLIK
jgi:quercetin dioxygenase-like cupin family protein